MKENQEKTIKKQYQKPELKALGALVETTKGATTGPIADGFGSPSGHS